MGETAYRLPAPAGNRHHAALRLGGYGTLSLGDCDFCGAMDQLTGIIRRYHALVPSSASLILKALVILYGASRLLSLTFSLMELLEPFNDIDARILWHYQAIVVSPNLLSTTPGARTAYLTCFKDKTGAYLNGSMNYRLRVPANPPVKRFWAVTAYDPATRGLLDDGGNMNKSVGSLDDAAVTGSTWMTLSLIQRCF